MFFLMFFNKHRIGRFAVDRKIIPSANSYFGENQPPEQAYKARPTIHLYYLSKRLVPPLSDKAVQCRKDVLQMK